MMGHLHMFRNRRPEISIIKQTLQFALFLIVCLWLLYQIHHSLYARRDSDCDLIDDRLIDERIAKLLGRKAGLGKSHYAEEMELYGVDLIGEAVTINNVTDFVDNQVDNPSSEENDEREQFDLLEHVESEIVEGKKGNDSMGGEVEMLMSENQESEIDSVVKVNAVILQKDGVLRHDSGPSKRSNVEVNSVRNGGISQDEIQTKDKEGCRKVCSKNGTENQRSKLEGEGVEITVPEIVTVQSEKRSMRDILLSEM